MMESELRSELKWLTCMEEKAKRRRKLSAPRCFQFSYIADCEERTVSTQSTFDRTISIMSLSPTCPKREDPLSWVKSTNVIKTGVFVDGSSGYTEKSPIRMDMLMLASGY
ncbi:hypothetical protein AAC387_Pa06g1814 [Persea americana]